MATNEEALGSLAPIALSLSGGGGRAAGFHLGTLSYLDHLDILKDVSILSSVSGGTFTAARYALALKRAPEGEDLHDTFRGFFDAFYDFLLNADLVNRAMKCCTGRRPETPSGRRTLITALAHIYNEDPRFMDGARFDTFFSGRDIHLKDIIFNATDLKHGLGFRFQKSEQPSRIGNGKVWITKEHAKSIRLADIVAASSDIPVGLEPLLFPQDFVWPDEGSWMDIRKHLQDNIGVDTLPLMDGGIYDNQGIESVMLAVRRNSKAQDHEEQLEKMELLSNWEMAEWYHKTIPDQDELGLFIISDVPLLSDDIYRPDTKHRNVVPITLGATNALTWSLFVISGLTAGVVIVHATTLGPGLGALLNDLRTLFLYVVPLILAGTLAGSLIWFRRKLSKLFEEVSFLDKDMWKQLKRLTISEIAYMIDTRIASTSAVTSDIFLNRIRRLEYSTLYSLPITSRLISHEIYDLRKRKEGLPEWLQPTPAMHRIATAASELGTTLWLTEQQLDDLVVCGQITTCFNVLGHLLSRRGESPLIDTLFAKASKDWEAFKKDSYALLPQAGKASGTKESSATDLNVRKAGA